MVVSPVVNPKNGELVGIVAVLRDVNKERKEEQRSADFISTASHEMRTPVAAIEGYLALALNEKVSKIDTRAREYLEKAHSSTQHLGKLFQDLLTSAKAEDGRLQSHPVVTEMGSFLEGLAEELRFSAEKKGLLVEFITGTSPAHKPSDPLSVTASVGKTIAPLYYASVDPDRMREVITNIFDNAVKYTESGTITVGITGNDEVVQIHVKDTGPGIPAEDLPHLFQKFYRVDNSATRSIGGTGLGLFICEAIVRLYNGTIWADSKVGEGSTFYINLPRLSSQQAAHLQSQEKTGPAQVV
jgi:signal transduction histidine kinase